MDSSCLNRAQVTFKVELHPSKLNDVEEGVREHLDGLLFRYQDDLESFVMAYDSIKIMSKNAAIHPYFPLVHVEVKAQALLFKPTVGSMLVGRVIKVAGDFIGLLVLGVFNASINADCIPSAFKCQGNAWVNKKDSEQRIEVGSDVRFQVVKLQEQAAFFGIFGSLKEKGTGVLKAAESGQREAANAAKDKEAKKERKRDEEKQKDKEGKHKSEEKKDKKKDKAEDKKDKKTDKAEDKTDKKKDKAEDKKDKAKEKDAKKKEQEDGKKTDKLPKKEDKKRPRDPEPHEKSREEKKKKKRDKDA